MIRQGDFVKVKVFYPKNPRLNGFHEGIVQKVGQFKTGFVYFKLNGKCLPLSRKYMKIVERR